MARFCPLASGSKGNCTFVETEQVRLLVDAGISARTTSERLADIEADLTSIDAILITHEHSDHIRGLETLCLRYGIPVFANAETAKAIHTSLGPLPKLKIFTTGEPFEFGDVRIHPFSVPHDAVDPVAFTFSSQEWKLGICTDLGFATTLVRSSLRNCTHLILEANHEPDQLMASSRPAHLKQRILGRSGHLSNQASGELLRLLWHQGLQHVFLAHLSEECNNPQTALTVVSAALAELKETFNQPFLRIAPQHSRAECLALESYQPTALL